MIPLVSLTLEPNAQMKRLVQAYFVEAKWYNSNYTPTMEEYMKNALITSTYRMLIATTFIGMGHVATEEVFQWLSNDPKIIRASNTISRLMDDIVSEVLVITCPKFLPCFSYQYF